MEALNKKMSAMSHFGLVAKKYYLENRKMMGLGAVAILGFWFIIGAWEGWFKYSGGASQGLFYYIIMMLVHSVVTSLMFRDMNGKQKRISTLMTPASIAEKFWIRFIVTIPLFILLILLGYCTLECGRMLFYVISTHEPTHFFLPHFAGLTTHPEGASPALLWTVIGCSTAFALAFYMVGAICWPKYSFLKTMALEYCIQFVFAIIFTITFTSVRDVILYKDISEEAVYTFLWTISAIAGILSVVGVWFSYYKFKTKTL
jgi:hypothetical protein